MVFGVFNSAESKYVFRVSHLRANYSDSMVLKPDRIPASKNLED
jgi:hypothetical protein